MSRRVATRLLLLLVALAVPGADAPAQAWSRTVTADQYARTERLIGIANGMLTITEVATLPDRRQTRTVKRARIADLDADATTVEVGREAWHLGQTYVSVRCRLATKCMSRTGGTAEDRVRIPFSDQRVARQFHADLGRAVRRAAPQRPPVVADRRPWGRQSVIDPTLLGRRDVEQHLALEGDRLAIYQRESRQSRPQDGITSSLSRVPVRSIDWRRTHVEVKENGVLAASLWTNPASDAEKKVFMRDFATFREFRSDMLGAAGVDARGILCVDPDAVVRRVPSLGRVVFDRYEVAAPIAARRRAYADSAGRPWQAMMNGTRGTPGYSRDSTAYQRLRRVRDSLQTQLDSMKHRATPSLQAPVQARIEAAVRSAAQRARVPYVATWFTHESFCAGLPDATDLAVQVLTGTGAVQPAERTQPTQPAQPTQPTQSDPNRRTAASALARLATVRIRCDSSCAVKVAGRPPIRLAAGMTRALQLPAGSAELAVSAPQGGEVNHYVIAVTPGRDTSMLLQAPWAPRAPRVPSRLADSLYAAAQDAYDRKAFGAAARPALRAAELGHTEAQGLVGRMYHRGEGFPRSMVNGLRWLRLAATGGHTKSASFLAAQYTDGWSEAGIRPDPAAALHWLRLAAEAGDVMSQEQLAIGYEEGRFGARPNETMALLWFRRAADNGRPSSAFTTGEYFAAGRGAPRNTTLAEKYFRIAQSASLYRERAAAALRRLGATP